MAERTDLDLRIQDLLFNTGRGRWLVDASDPLLRWFFYWGPKYLFVALFFVLLAVSLGFASLGRRLGMGRRAATFLVLSLAVVPTLAALGKSTTGVWCPSQIQRYGGDKPYLKLFEPLPAEWAGQRGGCFPAGHASGGFALMAFFYVPDIRLSGRRGLALGLTVGWAMGLYQMFRGAHYMSHTLVTMLAAWIVVSALARLLKMPKPVLGREALGTRL